MTSWWNIRHEPEQLKAWDSEPTEPTPLRLSLTAYCLMQEGRSVDALALAQEAEALPNRPREQDGPVYYTLGIAQAGMGHFDDARRYFGLATNAFEQQGDQYSALDARSEIGLTWHRQSEFVRALTLQQQCLEDARYLGHLRGEANAWNRIAIAQDRLGDYHEALESHRCALRIRQTLGDVLGEISSLGNIGNVHIQLRAYEEALQWLETSLNRSREAGLQKMYVTTLGNKGLALYGKEDFMGARQCHEESLALKLALGDVQGQANTLGNLANVLVDLGEHTLASERLDQALALNRRMGDRHSEVHNLITLGRLGTPEESLAALEQALSLSQEIQSRELMFLTHESLAKQLKSQARFEEALNHFEAFHQIKEEVFLETLDLRAQRLQAQHAVEQARKEAELQRLRTEELATALERAERLAREDGLTGLLNRRVGMQRLSEAHAHSQRHHRPLSVVLADVDHFKRINDRFLHAAGDFVLAELSNLLRQTCRSSDILARMGGEEFLIVLPDTDIEAAQALCERIRETVAGHTWDQAHPDLQVTLSMGICADGLALTAEQLLSYADARLYDAKIGGRNRICV
ncbi:MAG: diguanylate cyclase [Armatimonas sp.]